MNCGEHHTKDDQALGCTSEEKWDVQAMVREDNLGIATQRAATLRRTMEVCDKVKVGNFVALQTDHVER